MQQPNERKSKMKKNWKLFEDHQTNKSSGCYPESSVWCSSCCTVADRVSSAHLNSTITQVLSINTHTHLGKTQQKLSKLNPFVWYYILLVLPSSSSSCQSWLRSVSNNLRTNNNRLSKIREKRKKNRKVSIVLVWNCGWTGENVEKRKLKERTKNKFSKDFLLWWEKGKINLQKQFKQNKKM